LKSCINYLRDNKTFFKIDSMKYKSYYQQCTKSMTLGTAQFGFNYGITNRAGKVNKDDAIDIIKYAVSEGIEYIDTAAAYEQSENIVGQALKETCTNNIKIITKLPTFENKIYKDTDDVFWKNVVRSSILKSCANLQCSKIDTLMLHRANHLDNSQIIDELLSIRKDGIINKIGVSIQNASELKAALNKDFISIIQMPFNILDYRWDNFVDLIKDIKKKRELIIHARSVLLQGLLCSNEKDKWNSVGINNTDEIFDFLDKKFREYDKISISDLCIGYVNSQDWIDSVVVGVESKQNLLSNLQSVSKPFLLEKTLKDIRDSRPIVEDTALDPSTWN
jgi:aryl-alcohol dehydrogenase-like predicted oxidoreductase